ncbi:proteasome complex subunit Rpn13 ubiquitin receptor-domain-containing protein [Panaeolus papilionaceus]|nr:proteasome complex subunit Rpn13 ubiquitin receptor-domain-containing protein [Panaeolus papilionaceus]
MSFAASEIHLAFKAGRAFRREGSNVVECNPTKGAIYLSNGDDGLLHFIWKNRVTNDIEEDLILFPSDATFSKVDQSPSGRVHVLKFSSSNQRHFFWFQDANSNRDAEFTENLNGLLQDPDYDVQWRIPIERVNASATSASQPAASSSSTARLANPSGSSNFQATPEQLQALQRVLSGMRGSQAPQPSELSLTDILTPANLTPLFSSHPELVSTLFPHLPADLPVPPSAEALNQIIRSPQFRAAVSNFDQALRTGLLGSLVTTLGLPEEAGTGVAAFLRAIQQQADRERESENRMDTD